MCIRDRFLRNAANILGEGATLIVGVDLIKPAEVLNAAYNDAEGVTAKFNLNLLARINRELDADFVLEQFTHQARFNRETGSIEMHLRSTEDQIVSIPRAEISVQFRKNETIWTETSHKYSLEEVVCMAEDAGFRCDAQWADREWTFAENLLIAE